MSTTEDRLRAATRAAAQTVAPGSIPPPPPLAPRQRRGPAAHPRRGRGWPGWVAPLAAAAAVAAAIATSVVVSSALVIKVFDLAGGPVREWKAELPGGNVVGTDLLGANALSWAADGRTLVFDAWGPARVEVHALDTAAPGTSLSASRLVMTFPHWATTGSVSGSAIITPDGTKIIAMEVPSPRAATEVRVRQFSATNGRPLGILATIHCRKGAITGWPNVLWSNPSGSQLIISTTRLSAAPSKNGYLTPEEIGTVSGGRFVPLPGIPGGQRPVW